MISSKTLSVVPWDLHPQMFQIRVLLFQISMSVELDWFLDIYANAPYPGVVPAVKGMNVARDSNVLKQ